MGIFRAFGQPPSARDIANFPASDHFRQGLFKNLSPTAMMAANTNLLKMTWKFFNKPRNTVPPLPLPSIRRDLLDRAVTKTTVTWFGHSSYLIQIAGKNILVDPVMSGHASPFSFGVRSFAGTDIYQPQDLPTIDLLIITHDHYDHLDHRTLGKLKNKIGKIATSLGVGAHLRYWGFPKEQITEFDWWQEKPILDSIRLTATPARHFSGRSFSRNRSLWSSFVLQTDSQKIYIGADSGYDEHFKVIGETFGPFDLAILETGQYNVDWPHIHMMPEQAVQAALDLKAALVLPVHWAKFALAFHPWQEPIQRVLAKAKELAVAVATPMIGEPLILGDPYPQQHWWETAAAS